MSPRTVSCTQDSVNREEATELATIVTVGFRTKQRGTCQFTSFALKGVRTKQPTSIFDCFRSFRGGGAVAVAAVVERVFYV
ncbi:hypothetical protein Trydic_g10180 [Trypoxylus dichotomus]